MSRDVTLGTSEGVMHPRSKYGRTVELACEVMHDAYEAAAVQSGWETQARSRKPWAEVPEANKATMRSAVEALLDWLDRPAPSGEAAEPTTTDGA